MEHKQFFTKERERRWKFADGKELVVEYGHAPDGSRAQRIGNMITMEGFLNRIEREEREAETLSLRNRIAELEAAAATRRATDYFLTRSGSFGRVLRVLIGTFCAWNEEGTLDFLSTESDLRRLADVCRFHRWKDLVENVTHDGGKRFDYESIRKITPSTNVHHSKSRYLRILKELEKGGVKLA